MQIYSVRRQYVSCKIIVKGDHLHDLMSSYIFTNTDIDIKNSMLGIVAALIINFALSQPRSSTFILSLINPAVVNAGMDEVGFELTGHRPNGALSFKYGTEYYICFYMENGGDIEYVLAPTKFR